MSRGALLLATISIGCGEKSSPPASGSSETPALTAKADAAIAKVSAPELPKLTVAETFAAQSRDNEWAPVTETAIKQRFTKVRGAKLEDTECRQNQCRLVIAGSQGDVSRTIADLESDRGLHGFAKNILLTAPEKQADGSLRMRAFAIFDR